jgi:hypothetical protein
MSATDVIAAVLQFRESKRRDEELELLRQQVRASRRTAAATSGLSGANVLGPKRR